MEFKELSEAIEYAERASSIMGLAYLVLECTGGYFTCTKDIWSQLYKDRKPVHTTGGKKVGVGFCR